MGSDIIGPMNKKKRIGFDLDGVVVDHPPLISFAYLKKFVRTGSEKLRYCRPQSVWLRRLRKLSHTWFLRPPFKKTRRFIEDLAAQDEVVLYAISSRPRSLRKKTEQWLKKWQMDDLFEAVYINEDNQQAHCFKKNKLTQLNLDYYVEDDQEVVGYLEKHCPATNIIAFGSSEFRRFSKKFKNLRVLLSLTYYEPNVSGITAYARRIAVGLGKHNCQITILTSRHEDYLKERETRGAVTIVREKIHFLFNKGAIMLGFPVTAARLVRKNDVINCHLPQFEAVFLAAWAKIFGKKLVLTHHTDLSGWKGLSNRLAEVFLRTSQFLTALLADKIVTYTKDYASHSPFLNRFQDKVTHVYPPVVVSEPDKGYAKELESKFSEEEYLIGFSGRFAKQKGLRYLLEAIPDLKKQLGSFKILFAGPIKKVIGENYYREMKPLIDRYQKYLAFLGNLDQEQLAAFYQAIDVLVLPSDDRLESFGIVQVEAMLSGCPVVATNLPGMRVPVKETGMGLLFPIGDSHALAESIKRILFNRDQFVKEKAAIEKTFSYQNTVDFYKDLFRSLI